MTNNTIVFLLPREKYNGITSAAKIIADNLRAEFNFVFIKFSYLRLGYFKKFLLKLFPTRSPSILSPKDFGLSPRQVKIIENADLVHFWHPEPAGLFVRENSIISCHGIELLPEIIRKSGTYFFPYIFDKANIIHVASKATEQLLTSIIKPSARQKIVTIYPMIDCSKLKPLNRKKNNIPPVVGTLSRLVESKNINKTIEALKYYRNKYGDIRFILAGTGTQKNEILSKLKRYHIPFKYFGRINDNFKAEFLNMMDLFVLVTKPDNYNREGFGIVYIEANACGIPVLAANDGGVKEAVSQNFSGIFTDYGDASIIAKDMFNILTNKSYFRKSARRWAENFDYHLHLNEFREMYLKLTSK